MMISPQHATMQSSLSLSLCAAPDLDPTRGLTRSVRSSDSVTTDDITDGGRHRGFGWRWGRENCEHELESLAKDEARRHGEAWRGTAKLGPREPRARARISDEGRSDEARRSLARHGEAWRGTAKLGEALRGPVREGTRAQDLGFWFSDLPDLPWV
uniref:Uncharacterized protein n=1 Tax=Fagus sylvatica TaxID=28930 RepID=A0A2N9ELI1_FAGSY